jgi:hypothetical protein
LSHYPKQFWRCLEITIKNINLPLIFSADKTQTNTQ